jgi:enediyne polyketide synthase
LVMSIAGRGLAACDAEPIATRTRHQWRDLLGLDLAAMADCIATEAAEDLHAAATRVWAALECLKKAGMSTETPLVLRSVTPDRWISMAAGERVSIATWVGSIRGQSQPLAVALLVGSADAQL